MSNIDYAAVNRAALPLCPGLLESLLPGGTIQGREYQCSDLSGGGGDSLRVNMDTGKWADFATGDDAKGGDLVSLVAAIKGVNQPEAARVLSEMTGMPAPASTTAKRQQRDSRPVAIVPVPDGIKPPASFKHFRFGEPAATWEYRDASGRLLGYVGRFNKEEADSKGKLKKDFCPMVYTSQGWRWQGFPEPRPLYGLHRLAHAAPAASVLLVEGEGKADALQEALGANVAVLSLCGGCKAVTKLDFSPLQGRKVIYWPDADTPGAKAALLVCTNAKLAGTASVMVAVPSDGVPEGWDGADAIKEGWDRNRLTAHIKESCITHETFIDVAASRWGIDVDAMARAPEADTTISMFPDVPVPFEGQETPDINPAILPDRLREFVCTVADAVQVPPELVLINALSSMAIAVQGKARVVIHGDYSEPLNIYALVALPPGERKSAIVELCKHPLREWEQQAFLEVKDTRRNAEADRKSLEKVIEGKRGQLSRVKADERRGLMAEIRQLEEELPDVPEIPRLFVDDVTPEAIAALLAKQGERLGIQEAEGGIFDILAGRYSNGAPNIDLFLKAWGGEPVTVDRRRGEALRLQSPLLTVCISPQPDVIESLADKPGFRGRGLLARFLFVLPASRVGYRDIDTKPIPEAVKASYAQCIRAALAVQASTGTDKITIPHSIMLSPGAENIRRTLASHVEVNMQSGGELEGIKDWGNKLPGNATRIAGLLHFFAADSPLTTLIHESTMNVAATIAAVLVDHAKAAFSLMGDDISTVAAKRVLEWIRTFSGEFTGRECWRRFQGSFACMAEVNAALSLLEERGFIAKWTPEGPTKRGRPSQVWKVHPAIRGGGA